MTDNHGDVRREYDKGQLTRADLTADPLELFSLWLNDAQTAELTDATAMTVATADGEGKPAARIVLLKHHDADGFVFYTDFRSGKGQALAINPQIQLLFYWREFERQVRIFGHVEAVPDAKSTAYFHSRPLESQISAAASEQSAVIDSRQTLEQTAASLRDSGVQIAKPATWGGYCVNAQHYEFWQGRENRLHDRFTYTRNGADWKIDRLQP
ncbi:MAG: pyridoxamine 5'-phosphate oxidase [Limisphaerales bacterium]|jgi:pyridoxamine 5'-phosphate oxidase